MALNDRQRQFALRYLINGHNATEAYVSAGYSPNGADRAAHKLLRHAEVQAFLAEKLEAQRIAVSAQEGALELSGQRVLLEAMRVGYSDMLELWDEKGLLRAPKDIPETLRRAVSSVEVDEIWQEQLVKDEETGKTTKQRVLIGYTKKVKLWPKVAALELLGRNQKLWTDIIERRTSRMTPVQLAERTRELVSRALARAKANGKVKA